MLPAERYPAVTTVATSAGVPPVTPGVSTGRAHHGAPIVRAVTSEPRLVHIVDEVPELDDASSLTMVLALDGFLDAGNAAARAAQHLVDLSEGPVVATFDVDQFHDYRARRPPMSFVRDHYDSYDAPRLVVRLLADAGGTPYLLLHGPEPDNRWEAFAGAVREVIERLGVTEVISLASVPMAQPLVPSKPSGHQPSRIEKLSPPWALTFWPLVPEASMGRRGLLSHTSQPETSMRPTSMS